jgi:hypothetical protein
MRRLALAGMIVSLMVTSGTSASAANIEKLEAQVSGSTTGVSSFGSCPNGQFRSEMTGTYVTQAGGTGSYRIDVCLFAGGAPVFTITSGTFTITTPKGATLTGTVTGVGNASFIDDELTVTGGTRQFKHVSGSIDWDANGATPNFGTFTASFERR